MTGPRISSPSNARLRVALALRDRRAREEQGRTLVDGARETLRALEAGARVVTVFVCRPMVHGPEGASLLARLDYAEGPEVVEISAAAHARLAYGDRSDGIVSIVEVPRVELAGVRLGAEPLVAVLDGLEKPGNVGAIVRSADAAGLDAVILADAATDPFNPNAIRASLGTVFSLPVIPTSAGEARDWLIERGLRVVVARVDADATYDAIDYRPPTAIVLGSEARGLGQKWQGPDVVPVRLPMHGLADSLGVSAAAAVLFYEARRQRGSGKAGRSAVAVRQVVEAQRVVLDSPPHGVDREE